MKNISKLTNWRTALLALASGALLWSALFIIGQKIWLFKLPLAENMQTHGLMVLIFALLSWLSLQPFFAPVEKNEKPRWFYRSGRVIVSLWLLVMPFLFDNGVPEVGGDIRWQVTHVMAMLLSSLGLLALWQQRKTLEIRPYMPLFIWCLLGLVVTATLSFADSINPYRSWWFYKHFISFIAMAGFVYALRNPAWYRTLVWLLVLPTGPVAFIGICQFMNFHDQQLGTLWTDIWSPINLLRGTYPQAAVPGGTLSNKNLLGSYLVLILPLTTYLLVTAKSWSVRSLASVWLTLGIVALIFTRSRASWLSFAAMLVFLTLWVLFQPTLRQQIRQHLTWRPGLCLMAIVAVVAVVYPVKSPLKTTYAINISVEEQVKNISKWSNYGPRIAYNLNAFAMIADNPLTGVGIGAFHTAYPPYYKAFYPTPRHGYNVEARPQRTHDDLMQAFIEQGIIGGLLHLLVIFSLLQAAWRLARSPASKDEGLFPAFFITSILGLSLNSMGDFPLQMPLAPALLFACFGLLAGYARLHGQLPDIGWHTRKLAVARPVLLLATLVSTAGLLFIVQDDHHRRMGAYYLKQAMARNMAGIFDDLTLEAIRKSYDTYPYNARMQEFRGIIYAHYAGPQPMPMERRAEVLREAMTYDPNAANHLINLASLLHKMAERDYRLGNHERAVSHLKEIQDLVDRLLVIAPFSHHTWNLKGLLEQRQGLNNLALQSFLHSLQILPKNTPAVAGLKNLGVDINSLQAAELQNLFLKQN